MAAIKYPNGSGGWNTIYNLSGIESHVHGNITNDGKVGDVAGKFLMTGANGLITANMPYSTQNLLHNWDFRNPVNQRGVSGTISTAGYFYDRWMLNSGSVTTNGSYLTIAAGAVVEQRIEGNLLASQVVTVTVMVGGLTFSGTGTMPGSGTASVTIAGWGTATLGYATGYTYLRLSPTAASNVQAVKMELGTISTLHLDPPIDYGIELEKCLRYFQAFGDYPIMFGYAYATTGGFAVFPTLVKFRITPTMSASQFTARTAGAVVTCTITSWLLAPSGFLRLAFTGTGLYTHHPIAGHFDTTNITGSADL